MLLHSNHKLKNMITIYPKQHRIKVKCINTHSMKTENFIVEKYYKPTKNDTVDTHFYEPCVTCKNLRKIPKLSLLTPYFQKLLTNANPSGILNNINPFKLIIDFMKKKDDPFIYKCTLYEEMHLVTGKSEFLDAHKVRSNDNKCGFQGSLHEKIDNPEIIFDGRNPWRRFWLSRKNNKLQTIGFMISYYFLCFTGFIYYIFYGR